MSVRSGDEVHTGVADGHVTAATGATWERSPGWGVADRPGEGEHGGRMYAAPLATGVIHVLEGPAAVVCRAALAGHDMAGIREAAAADLDVAADSVDVEVLEELIGELVGLGVLRRLQP